MKEYLVHEGFKDVCFMPLNKHSGRVSGVWINISHPDPQHHFVIEMETIKEARFKRSLKWTSFSNTTDAHFYLRRER